MNTSGPTGNTARARWAMIGKAAAAVAAMVALLAGLVTLYDRFTKDAKLAVVVSMSPYYAPPAERIDSLNPARPPELRAGNSAYSGFISISLSNNGGTQAEGVEVLLPYSGVAQVRSYAGDARFVDVRKSIPLGALPPGESIEVRLWTAQEVSIYNEDELRVTHTRGNGALVFLHESDGFLRTLWRGVSGVLKIAGTLLGIALGSVALLSLVFWLFDRTRGAPPAAADAGKREDEAGQA